MSANAEVLMVRISTGPKLSVEIPMPAPIDGASAIGGNWKEKVVKAPTKHIANMPTQGHAEVSRRRAAKIASKKAEARGKPQSKHADPYSPIQ